MVSEDELVSQFSDLGVAVTDQKIIDKCVDLCITHRMNEEDLVNAWMAFSITNLDGADPTLETLLHMERKDLVKNETQMKTPRRPSNFTNSATKPAKVLVYEPADQLDSTSDTHVDDLMDTYQNQSYQTPKAKRKAAPRNEAAGAFSPVGYSPKVATPSQRYDSRGNAGEVLLSLGNELAAATWTRDPERGRDAVSVTPRGAPWPAQWRYMLDCSLLLDEAGLHDDQVEYLAGQIRFQAGLLADSLDSNPALPAQEAVYFWGRVCNAESGAMTSKSVLLEAGLRFEGAAVPLSLSRLPAYSLFPGQVVLVRGANPTGQLILVDSILTSAPLPLPAQLPALVGAKTRLQVVVAAGPFTTQDTLTCRPLEDLVVYVTQHQPHVLVLVGPFVDVQHPLVKEGLLAEPFNDFLEKRFIKLADATQKSGTRLVLVSSWREASHHAVFPTPPYRLPRWPASVLRLPDPAVFDVDGVVFAVTATDVLKNLASQELSFCSESHRKAHGYGNRVHRLAEHLLAQQSFYPLHPPAEELNVDAEMFRTHGHLDATPHVLVLPSDMRFFATEVNGCTIVNPERLAKGLIGGTFARFEISAPQPDATPKDFHRNISVNIVQI